MAAVDTASRDGVSLVVTVDTGSTSVAEIAAAAGRGIDVIITDHHHLPDVLPAAVALVNPQRDDAAYPDRRLSGSGVAFAVARLVLRELAGAEAEALELADLATIGTFVLALLLGIVSGTYSSIFNAAPLLVVWHQRDDRRRAAEHAARPSRRPAT